ncbi:MAG: hypothetical protein AB7O39_03265 [Flavobacteriaceae bacterium]
MKLGERIGYWTVLEPASPDKKRNSRWLCRCVCGVRKTVYQQSLASGKSRSCGCATRVILRDATRKAKLRHGHTANRRATAEYDCWTKIKGRCFNPGAHDYPRYGGRGITVAPEWKCDFEKFLSDMGPRPDGMSIDRIDVNGNYEPGNCRWATDTEQARNRRNSCLISAFGMEMNLHDLCDLIDGDAAAIYRRIHTLGWAHERAITTPSADNGRGPGGRYYADLSKVKELMELTRGAA